MKDAKRIMPRCFAAVAAVAVLSCAAFGDSGIFVRPSDNGRTWQVNVDPDRPIVWSWPEEATSARLVVTSYVEKAVFVYDIDREENADFHEWMFGKPDAVSAESEYLYDLSLTIFGGETVLQRESARVVCLPQAFSLVPAGTAGWRDIAAERIFPYDAVWNGAQQAEGTAVSFATEGVSPETFALAGISGWEPLSLSRRFDPLPEFFSAALVFGDETACEASLRRVPKGFVLMVR